MSTEGKAAPGPAAPHLLPHRYALLRRPAFDGVLPAPRLRHRREGMAAPLWFLVTDPSSPSHCDRKVVLGWFVFLVKHILTVRTNLWHVRGYQTVRFVGFVILMFIGLRGIICVYKYPLWEYFLCFGFNFAQSMAGHRGEETIRGHPSNPHFSYFPFFLDVFASLDLPESQRSQGGVASSCQRSDSEQTPAIVWCPRLCFHRHLANLSRRTDISAVLNPVSSPNGQLFCGGHMSFVPAVYQGLSEMRTQLEGSNSSIQFGGWLAQEIVLQD